MELDFNSIMSPDDIENLFSEEDDSTSTGEKEKEEIDNKTTEIDPEDLFSDTSESVGSEDSNKGKESTGTDSTSPNSNIFSVLTKSLSEEGIFHLNEEDGEIDTPEKFKELFEKTIQRKFDEKQKRIDEALNYGIEPDKIKGYENTISYLNDISESSITDESEQGENLRKQLILQDFLNKGFTKERALKEVEKSFKLGNDLEDAKSALDDNKDFFKKEYDKLISDAREEEINQQKEIEKQQKQLKDSFFDKQEVFKGISITDSIRQKAYDSITKPVHEDKDTNRKLTAIQYHEKTNRQDFLKKLGFIYAITDGFKDLTNLAKPIANKEIKKGLNALESAINNTARTSDGNLNFVGSDRDSKLGFTLDV